LSAESPRPAGAKSLRRHPRQDYTAGDSLTSGTGSQFRANVTFITPSLCSGAGPKSLLGDGLAGDVRQTALGSGAGKRLYSEVPGSGRQILHHVCREPGVADVDDLGHRRGALSVVDAIAGEVRERGAIGVRGRGKPREGDSASRARARRESGVVRRARRLLAASTLAASIAAGESTDDEGAATRPPVQTLPARLHARQTEQDLCRRGNILYLQSLMS